VIELSEILGNLTLAVGIVEGVINHLRGDAEPRGLIAVDGHLDARGGCLKVGRYINELFERL